MFEKITELVQMINEARNNRCELDLTQFEDPIATQTKWSLLKNDGVTHRIVKIDSDRLEFRVTWGVKLLCMLVFSLVFLTIIISLSIVNVELLIKYEYLLLPSIVIINVVIWSLVLYFYRVPIVFDKQRGYFWKGSNEIFNKDVSEKYANLDKIYALQLISELRGGTSKRRYYIYELNLVMDNGDRINVVHHGYKDIIRENANVLSGFLGVPVWDGINR